MPTKSSAAALRPPRAADRRRAGRCRARSQPRRGVSIEQAAHTARHAFFERAAVAAGASVVAVAHTKDDQAETFLLRLLRGAGPRGLSGMHPRSGMVVRPFIDTPRADVRAFLDARQHRVSRRRDERRFAHSAQPHPPRADAAARKRVSRRDRRRPRSRGGHRPRRCRISRCGGASAAAARLVVHTPHGVELDADALLRRAAGHCAACDSRSRSRWSRVGGSWDSMRSKPSCASRCPNQQDRSICPGTA